MHKTNTTSGRLTFLTLAGATLVMLAVAGRLHAQAPSALPPGEGKELVEQTCTQCHGLRVITMLRDGPLAWKKKVDDMIVKGTQLMPEEAETVSRYLAKNFGPGRDPMKTGKVPGAAPKSLPPGPGKELVESRCTVCHDSGVIVSVKRTKDDWANVVENMFSRGPTATPAEMQTMTSYLFAQWGKDAE